jgi:4a-hydroxytetrahydrobiopterin dehydratase
MSELATLECVPCRGGVPPLKGEQIKALLSQLQGWEVVEEHHLLKSFKTSNFIAAQDLATKIGELAESQGHHPDICFGWGYCDVKIWTHKIDGLTESDFILAAKIDQIQA